MNLARFTFLQPEQSRAFYPSWEGAADINVAILRTEAGRNPHDTELQSLIGELSTVSEEFRSRWGAHNVRHTHTATNSSAPGGRGPAPGVRGDGADGGGRTELPRVLS